MHLRSRSVASLRGRFVLLDASVPAALGLGNRINYNPLLRIEINDIGFVFYARMGLYWQCAPR